MHSTERKDLQELIDNHVKNDDICELKDLLSYVEAQIKSSKETLNNSFECKNKNASEQSSIISKIGLYSLASAYSASLLMATEEVRDFLIVGMVIILNVMLTKTIIGLFSKRAEMYTLHSDQHNAKELNESYREQVKMIQDGLNKITSAHLGEKIEQI